MAKFGKKYQDALKLIEADKFYAPKEAVELVKKTSVTKFDSNVGGEELVAKIQGGWTDFEVCVATPDMMGVVGRLGKILGPKGLMPNPKVGTVTMDVTRAINEIKAGKIEYRTDKAGNVQAPIGKASFTEQQLLENYITLVDTLIKVKPSGAKGQYIKSINVSTTMGPGVKIDVLKANSDK